MSSQTFDIAAAQFCPTQFPKRDFDITRQADGTILLHNRLELVARQQDLPAYLHYHAEHRPDAIWLARRAPGGGEWQRVSFGQARQTMDALTQGLLDLGLQPGDPLAILSGNSLEHALISFAAMQARLPVVPISPAYALQSSDFAKLRELFATVPPKALFVQDGAAFARAIEGAGLAGLPVVAVDNVDAGSGWVSYRDLAAREPGPDARQARNLIDPTQPAKYMFTSGSTGSPKAVPQTQRNLCVASEAILASFGETGDEATIRLDWAPWSHVFGAANLYIALMSGGTLYIDDGRPAGNLIAETLRNLREVSPTTYANVPAGYAAIIAELERDDELARTFFGQLKMLGYAAAALPEDIAHRMQRLAIRHTGGKVPFTSGYGATETCPAGACVFWETDTMGLIGLPQPGYDMKLVPIDEERYEVRIRGEGVMSGYHGRPELNAEIFDEDGFYRMGDAVSFADPDNVLEGLKFAGRLTEEFKLQTGTFVRVGPLRMALLEAAKPLLKDLVVCGENQAYLAILAWIDPEAAASLNGDGTASREALNANETLRQQLATALAAYNRRNPGNSTRVERFLLLDEPASIDKGEITDKGSINQRMVQRNRQALVQRLYADPAPDDVVVVANLAVPG